MRILAFFLALVLPSIAADPVVGPANGTLFIHGGGRLTAEQVAEFIRLGGGVDAPFVIIPTADFGEEWADSYVDRSFLTRAGVQNIRALLTRNRDVANSPTFVEPLTKAKAVWIEGGRQWRLAHAYLGTRTQVELQNLLARGGLIGGSSAGATIQGSFMVRGAPEGNHVIMSPGNEEGFAFLKNVAIDQHVIARKREKDMLQVVAARPELLGLALDEATALIVQGDRARVLGSSKVLVYHRDLPTSVESPYLSLASGETLDLAARRPVSDPSTR
jgi:cyanophycinase